MRTLIPILMLVVFCAPVFADIEDDGVISVGEYDSGRISWITSNPPLIVEGGGANWIDVREHGRVEVRYTSAPVNGDWHTGGIRDIDLDDNAQMLYLGGITDLLSIDADAIAVLKGGTINYIHSLFNYRTNGHVDLYCRPGWSWILDTNQDKVGITGLWQDNMAFDIEFINDDYYGYDPVWMGINVIEVPEPATLLLIAAGGLLIRRRQ